MLSYLCCLAFLIIKTSFKPWLNNNIYTEVVSIPRYTFFGQIE